MMTPPHEKQPCYCKDCEKVSVYNTGYRAGLARAAEVGAMPVSAARARLVAERIVGSTVAQGGVPLLTLPQRRGQLRVPLVDETVTGFFTIRRASDVDLTIDEVREGIASVLSEGIHP